VQVGQFWVEINNTVAGSAQDGVLSPHAASKATDVAAKITAVCV
jgi:hypothetical protein